MVKLGRIVSTELRMHNSSNSTQNESDNKFANINYSKQMEANLQSQQLPTVATKLDDAITTIEINDTENSKENNNISDGIGWSEMNNNIDNVNVMENEKIELSALDTNNNTNDNTQEKDAIFDATKDKIRKLYVYGIICLWFFVYFIEGFSLPFVSEYANDTLNLSESIGTKLIFFFFLGSLAGRFIGVIAFTFIKFWKITVFVELVLLSFASFLSLSTIIWINGNKENNIVSEELFTLILYANYIGIGCCRAILFSAIFGLISPVHAVTSLVATGDAFACASAFAFGGYGIGSFFDILGNYNSYPFLFLWSSIMQIVLLSIMIPFHNKIDNQNNQELQQKEMLDKTEFENNGNESKVAN